MAKADRVPAQEKHFKKSLQTGKVVPAPPAAAAGSTPTKAEFDALRATVVQLRDAAIAQGSVKAS